MSWEEFVERYLGFLRIRYASATLDIVERWLRRFARFATEQGVETPAAVLPEHLDAFHGYLLWSPGVKGLMRPSSIDQGLRVVRASFRWAVRLRLLVIDPCRHLVLPRAHSDQALVLTVAEVDRLLAVPRLDSPRGIRDRAVLETFYATGMRRGEGWALNLGDIDFQDSVLHIRTSKNGQGRMLPMGEHLFATLQHYLRAARPRLVRDPAHSALFLSQFGTRFSRVSIMALVKGTALRAGLPPISTHSLRHSFARHMLEAGASIEDIQHMLGHRGLHATHIYTRLRPDDVALEHRRTHPRAGLFPPTPPAPPSPPLF